MTSQLVDKFMEWDGTQTMVRCSLCNTGFMHKHCAHSHFGSEPHLEKARIASQQEKRIKEANLLCILVEGESWKRNVKARVHDYVFENKGTMQEININIQKYSKMDKTSLLELAIIKASICDGVTFEDMQQVHDYHALDEAFNFFEFMEASRVTSGVEIIIPGVVDFLKGLPEW